MRCELHVRPPADVCPEEYCFNWLSAGGKAAPRGQSYATSRDALTDSVNWPVEPVGRCDCPFGRCTRLDPAGDDDWYEPHELRLERDGLPWFYFCTRYGLNPEVRAEFDREAPKLWVRPGRGLRPGPSV